MKRILQLLFTFFSIISFAQVGVNTTAPDPSSMLDISATDKGVLVPRVNLNNVTTIMLDGTNTAATGLLIWNTNATTTGGNGVGFYFFNGTQWMPITQTVANDDDFYEIGSTTPPNSITDNKYTQGSITIGSNVVASGVLDIDNATKATSLDINNTFATNPIGINLNITTNTAGKNGIKTEFNGTSTNGTNSFISNTDNLIGNTSRTAISNDFNGTSSSGATLIVGMKNNFKSSSNYLGSIQGIVNTFESNTAANRVGLINNFINGGSNVITGVINSFNGTGGTGIAKAIRNTSYDYSGIVYGMDNTFEGNGDGNHYGVFNLLSGYGTGDKYGVYNSISNTAGGIHYGIYSDVLKTGSYAGYFLGNVSIGTTTANNYILPTSRGINGQIMQTDGTGNVSWVTPTTGTDDQNLTTPTLTGTTLNLGIENGTGTSVDLASLKDHDWYEIGTTTAPNDINDNIFTQGKVAIGKNTASYRFEVEETGPGAAFPPIVAKFTDNSTSTNTHNGVYVDMTATTTANENGLSVNLPNPNSAFKKGVVSFVQNGTGTNNAFEGRVSGSGYNLGSSLIIFDSGNPSSSQQKGYEIQFRQPTTGNTYGLLNTFMTNNLATDNGAKYGIYNNFGINTGGELYGLYNYFDTSLTSTANKYGVFTDIPTTLGGTHYGIYSRVFKAGSYAAFFQGNVAVGTNGANFYILPPSRGSNGQIMQTDGSGNVSWVTPTTGTDDQNLTTPTLTGTTLNLGIENGTGTSINLASLQDGTGTDDQNLTTPTLTGTTLNLGIENGTGTSINLASLDTDNQQIDVLTLTGDTLNISLQDDGVATQTLNLAAIDNQATDVFNLTGTTLNLSLQNDGVPTQTVNLASLVGTDDQNLVTPTLVGTTLNLNIENGTGTSINLASLDTDNQQIDVLTLIGDTLNISLQDDGVPTQTLNLAAIDNQTIDTFSLVGTTLGISLQNDGVPTQTVNLASLVGTDDQNLITPTLVGTTLNLNIENGTGTSIDLGSLQDGIGTDDQIIDNFSLSGTTLRLSLENDGQPLQTVNLASLVGTDDQNLVTPTLVGTTLNLNIENGTGTSIDLAPLQDGIGTDDQNIQNLNFNTTTNILTVGIENGTSQTVDLSLLDTGGDITAVNAGAGLTGGGITGALTLTAAANNGLNVDAIADAIQLGGPLTENTTITNGAFNMIFDVNTTGTFKVQDAGVDKFEMNTFGDGVFGGATYWRNGSTATTDAILGRFIPNAGSGLFEVHANGIMNHTINGNGNTRFNNQGLDLDFAIESDTRADMFYVDAGENLVRIANTLGGTPQDGTVKVVNALNVTVDYIAKFSDGGSGSTIGIGSAEFMTDGGNQIVMMDSNLTPFNDNDDALGSSDYRWTAVWAVDGTINTSDVSLKKNIKPLNYGLKDLMDIETITYQWKNSDFEDTKIGFSAQNLKSIIPEVVRDYDVVVTDETSNSKIKVPSNKLGVYYSDLIPVTVKAIQELKEKNDQLEERVKELEAQLSRLEIIEKKLKELGQ